MADALVVATTLVAAWLPGATILRLAGLRRHDLLERVAHELAAGLAFWPLLFLLTSTMGLSWSAVPVRLFLFVMTTMLAVLLRNELRWRRLDRIEWTGLAVLLVVALTRWLHIRGIAWPLWVDSVHHTMIIRLLLDHGTLPDSYAPFIERSTFYYHWGFHSFVAVVSWASGLVGPVAQPRVLLVVGQVLSVAMAPAVYVAAKTLLRSRSAAILAAVLATLVSFFPAYYVSWGRYPQLLGLILLPPLAAGLWRLGRRPRARNALEVVLLSAGLLLVHVRVAVVFALLALVITAILAMQRRWTGIGWCAAAAVLSFLLAGPWLLHLRSVGQVGTLLAPPAEQEQRWETPNALPADLTWAPQNVPLYVVASGGLFALMPFSEVAASWRIAGIGLWLLLVLVLWRRGRIESRRRTFLRLAVPLLWIGLTAIVINGRALGLPAVRIVPNSAAIIMLFLPLAVMAAEVLRMIAAWIARPAWRGHAMLAITFAAAFWGAWSMRWIVNPETVLVMDADRAALSWIRTHVASDARFAAGVQPWLGDSFIGIDGGYWIPLVAERSSILPPGLYPWVVSESDADALAVKLRRWHEAQSKGDVTVLLELQREGVTHLYFGARNGTRLRTALRASPAVESLYDRDGVWIAAIR